MDHAGLDSKKKKQQIMLSMQIARNIMKQLYRFRRFLGMTF